MKNKFETGKKKNPQMKTGKGGGERCCWANEAKRKDLPSGEQRREEYGGRWVGREQGWRRVEEQLDGGI